MSLELKPGFVIESDYELVKKLDELPGTQKWLAESRRESQTVSITFAGSTLNKNQISEYQERLLRVKELAHPNILLPIEINEFSKQLYVVEPHAVGSRLLQNNEINLHAFKTILDVAIYAHDRGIAHGRLHPGSLSIDKNYKFSVKGFGVPREFSPDQKYQSFIRRKKARNIFPEKEDDYFSLGKLLSFCIFGSTEVDLNDPYLDLATQTRELLKGLTHQDEENPKISLNEARSILDKHVFNGLETIKPVPYKKEITLQIDGSRKTPNDQDTLRKKVWAPRIVGLTIVLTILLVPLAMLLNPSNSLLDSKTNPSSDEAIGTRKEKANKILTPKQLAESELIKERGKEIAREILRKQLDLEGIRVRMWAKAAYENAQETFNLAENLFLEEKFEESLSKYQETLSALTSIQESSEKVLEEQVNIGNSAIENLDPIVAIEAFSIATSIDRENSTLLKMLEKARNLGQLIEIMDAAKSSENNRELETALSFYRKALDLDKDWSPAAEALLRVRTKIDNERYLNLVSEGYKTLDQQNYSLAIQKFQQARELMPDRNGAKEGILQVKQARVNQKVNRLIGTANDMLEQLNWQGAILNLEAALKLSPGLKNEKVKLKEAKERASLIDLLQRIIENPTVLKSDSELSNAMELLTKLSSKKNMLRQTEDQMQLLATYISLARIEVPVYLISNGKSEITIERTLKLGKFDEKVIALIPGTYFITSVRPGFRDIRKELIILPGSKEVEVNITNMETVR